MGGKQSKNDESKTSLNPNERRRLTAFLESRGRSSELFSPHELLNMWRDILVPDLLNMYTEFLMKQDIPNNKQISLEQFVTLYSALVRGDVETKAVCISHLLSPPDYRSSSQHMVPFNRLCKYVSDLLESYFKGARYRNDTEYNSWTSLKHPERAIIEVTMRGVCNDLPKTNDEVSISDLETWINHAGLVNALHVHVLGFMYSLEPEDISNLIPLASFPTTRTPTCFDLSQVAFINALLPFENKSEWRFLFSTSTHGESYAKFVGCIMNQGPLLLVLECADKSKFGGFISESISPGPRWVGTDDSFLFKLSPRTEAFVSTGYNNHFAYLNMNQTSFPNGLGMGGQFNYWGLWIDSHFGDGECSESCSTYKNYSLLATKKNFHITKLEVWGVGDPPQTEEERGERKPTSVLDKDAAASHMLEMAGRQTHSKGLREEPDL